MGTEREKHQKFVMTQFKMTLKDVVLIVCRYFQLGFVLVVLLQLQIFVSLLLGMVYLSEMKNAMT